MMWKLVFLVLAAVFTAGIGAMLGGLRDIDVNDAGLQKALNFAISQHNRESNDLYPSQMVEVIRAQSQVVSGIKYVITVKLERTHCRQERDTEVCDLFKNPEMALPYQCTFTVWTRPWLDDIKMVKKQC